MSQLTPAHATIAVVTVLPSEFTAVQRVLSAFTRCTTVSGRICFLARVLNIDGKEHTVLVTRTPKMGNVAASEELARLHEDCARLQHTILCGIAGGAPCPERPERHVRLGDIVVSTEGVVFYGNRKEHEGRQEIRPVHIHLLEGPLPAAVRRLENAAIAGDRPWEGTIDQLISQLPIYDRPAPGTDTLVEPSRVQLLRGIRFFDRQIQHPADPLRAFSPTRPRVFLGRIASADAVQANPRLRDQMRDEHNVRAFEMEAFGFALGAENRRWSYMVVRAICDYANARKNRSSEEQWQLYAANAAASYTLALIRELPVTGPRQLAEAASYLSSLQRDGAVPTTEEADMLRSIGTIALNPAHAGRPTGTPGGRTTDSPADGERQLAVDLLEAVKRAEDLQRTFDFEAAFTIADQVERQTRLLQATIPPHDCADIYYRLARINFTRAELNRARDPSVLPDYSAALALIDLARNVGRGP